MAKKTGRRAKRQARTGEYATVRASVHYTVKRRLERRAEDERLSLSAIIGKALEAYVTTPAQPQGYDLPNGVRLEELQALQARVAKLEGKK